MLTEPGRKEQGGGFHITSELTETDCVMREVSRQDRVNSDRDSDRETETDIEAETEPDRRTEKRNSRAGVGGGGVG